jgi:VanZ family protein
MKLLIGIRTYWAALTLFILVAITALSLWPLPSLPAVPGSDKTLHLVAYGALMFPVALRRPTKWIWMGLSFIAYSGMIEWVQPYVNRHAEWSDMAANTAGIVCGLLFALVIRCTCAMPRVGVSPRG